MKLDLDRPVSSNMIILGVILVVSAVVLISYTAPPVARIVAEYKGEFSDIDLPSDVIGYDLMKGDIKTISGESLGTIYNTSTNFTTAHTQIVSGTYTIYADGTDISTISGVNLTDYDLSTGRFELTANATNWTITIDYDYQLNLSDVFNKTDDSFQASFLTDSSIRGGQIYYLCYKFKIDDDVEKLSVEGERSSTSIDIREVYILPDDEDYSIDDVLYSGDVEPEMDEFDLDVSSLAEGEYVMCIKVKATSDISAGTELFDDIDMEITTDGDRDSGTVDIYVKAY